MQSSLLNQLNNLKKNQKTAPILPYKAQCSLLFDFKFANVISAEEVYEIGYQGLIELTKIDEKFEKYLKALFSSTSKYFNREMIPKSEIKTFDAQLKNLLIDLSEYFYNKNSHQVIEYLIKVYKVNLYLSVEFIFPFLCYYQDKIFIKMLQNINFNEHPTFLFLENFAKDSVVIPEETMYKYIKNNFEFLTQLIYFYIENISLSNEYYFNFVINVLKYKIESMNTISDKEKNLFTLIVKLISYVNKIFKQNISEEKEEKILIAYSSFFNLFLSKINLSPEYIKAFANDLCSKVMTYLTKENSFSLLLLILSKLSKNFYDSNNTMLFKDDSLQVIFSKSPFYENASEFLINSNNSNVEYLSFEFILSAMSINNFGLVKELLSLLFENESVVEKTMLLLSKHTKQISNWTLIEDLNQRNVNLAFISLYKSKKINALPLKNHLDLYFNIISSSVPQVITAINECNKNAKVIDDNIISALSSKFTMFDEEIILNAILNIKNLNFEKISNEVLYFYYEIMKGKVHSYSEKLIKQVEQLLNKYNDNNEKYILFRDVFFNSKKTSLTSFKFNKGSINEYLIEIVSYQDKQNESLNISNVLSVYKLLFKEEIANEEELSKIEELLKNKNLHTIYTELYKEISNDYITYLTKCYDNKYIHLLNISKMFISKNDYESIENLLNVHFSKAKQIYLGYLLIELKELYTNSLIDFVIKIIKNEKQIEFVLYMSLLSHLSEMTSEHFAFFYNTNQKFSFTSLEKCFNDKAKSTSSDKTWSKVLSDLSQTIYNDKSELKVNKQYVSRLFESNSFDIEQLYLISNEVFLSYQHKSIVNFIYAILSLFTKKMKYDEKYKTLLLKHVTESINMNKEEIGIISNLLLKNYLIFYPKSEKEIVLLMKDITVSSDIVDILFQEGFPINTLSKTEDFFTVINFCIKNKVSPFKLGVSLSEEKTLEYLSYITSKINSLPQSHIVFFFKLLVLSPNLNNNMNIIKDTISTLKHTEDFNINICYAVFALTKSLSSIALKDSEGLLKEIEEIFKKLVSYLNIENLFNYEQEKKIQLLFNTANKLSLLCPSVDNNLLISSYNHLNATEHLSKILKREIYNIIFSTVIEYIDEHYHQSKDINEEFYYKYIDIIVKHKEIEYKDESIVKLSKLEMLNEKSKLIAFFYYEMYSTFKENKNEIISSFIISKSKSKLQWMNIIQDIIELKKKEKVSFDLINNVLSYLLKQNIYTDDKETNMSTSEKILNIITLIYLTQKDITDKLIQFSKKQNLLSNIFIVLYSKRSAKSISYSTSKNFILNKITPLIQSDSELYDFILNDIILSSKENRCENLIPIYSLLTRLTNKKSNFALLKKIFSHLISNTLSKISLTKDVSTTLYYFNICKFLIKAFNTFSVNALSFFNSFMPLFIKGMNETKTMISNKDIRSILFDNLSNLTLNLCDYLSPFLNDLLKVIISYQTNHSEIKNILTKIAQKNLFDSNFKAIKSNVDNMNELLIHFLNVSIQSCDKLIIADVYMDIAKFFMKILNSHQRMHKEIDECVKSFVLKINEKQLKKIFEVMLLFLKEKNDLKEYKVSNCIIVFEIFNTILNVIRDIFIGNYYPKYKNIQVDLIKLSNAFLFKKDSVASLKTKRERPVDEEEFSYSKLSALLLSNIKNNFKYSKGENLPDSIDDLFEPIIEQFKLTEERTLLQKHYDNNIKDCICEMFINIKDDDMFKSLNDDILNLIREENYVTRLMALKMILYLFENVKERYLTLVGDVVPYVADTLEDSNELVQKEAVETIQYIEKITGEKYSNYLE